MPEWILHSGASFAVSYLVGRWLCAHAHSDKMNKKNTNLAQWRLSNKVCYNKFILFDNLNTHVTIPTHKIAKLIEAEGK